ncbi:two-component sensor histidine kinase, partial [Kibdelosporangium lantanae]
MSVRSRWLRRSVRLRITIMATVATLVILLGLAWWTGGRIGALLITSTDNQLRPILDSAVADVSAGRTPTQSSPYVQVRVLDTAGAPVDNPDMVAIW